MVFHVSPFSKQLDMNNMFKLMRPLNVLVACESSGEVRNAFRRMGHNAWSCDFLPADDKLLFHIQDDALEVAYDSSHQWDLMIAHPPCTYLCSSGLHWNKRTPGRAQKTEDALIFFKQLMIAPIPMKAIENPIGCVSTRIRKPTQIIQPYQFGHDASKATCLWLIGLPKLEPTEYINPRLTKDGKKRWGNQTDSGQNNLGPSPDRWKERSKTYSGIAKAMAEQWG